MATSLNAQRFAVVVALLTVIASSFFTISALVDPGGLVPGGDQAASRTYAAYMAARNIVLAGGLIWLLVTRAWRSLSLLLVLNGAVQLIDAAIGAAKGQIPPTLGPVCFAVALVAASMWLARSTAQRRHPLLGAQSDHP